MIYPLAVQEPGPSWKQGYPPVFRNACRGVVCHSMVGSYAEAKARLDSQDRASWHFSVLKNGTVIQHYQSDAVTWHAGTAQANQRYIGIEHEGGADTPATVSEPLTTAQREASTALVRWLALQHGFPRVRRVGLWAHNELWGTACPSQRIPWAEYEEGDELSSPEYDALFQRDEDIKAVLKQVNDRCLAALNALFALAKHVYGDNDPQTKDIEQRLKALED